MANKFESSKQHTPENVEEDKKESLPEDLIKTKKIIDILYKKEEGYELNQGRNYRMTLDAFKTTYPEEETKLKRMKEIDKIYKDEINKGLKEGTRPKQYYKNMAMKYLFENVFTDNEKENFKIAQQKESERQGSKKQGIGMKFLISMENSLDQVFGNLPDETGKEESQEKKEEKPLSVSEKNQEEINKTWAKEEKTEKEKEKKDKDKKETTEEKKESKEISELITARFEDEMNIKKEDLEKIEGFDELSPGQQLLALENLKQVTLKEIHGEGLAKSKEQITNAKFLGRIWKGISKKYQIAKIEKSTAKEIKEGGIKFHKKTLEQLSRGMKANGPEVRMKGGHLEIQYAPVFFKDFNETATKFSRIPDEWSKETASKEEQEKYKQAKEKYEQEKKDILNFKAEQIGEEYAAIYMNSIESNIILNQLLNTHPEVEKQLKKIEDEKVWKKVLKDIVTERGIYAGAGFLTRTATISMIGMIGAPLAAAGMGGFMARKRAKETLKEREIMAREGEEDKSKEAKDFVDAEYLHESIDFLIDELILEKESLDVGKKEEMIRSLKFHIEDAQNKIKDGTVNYGKKDVRLFNQYELIEKISSGISLFEYLGSGTEYKEKYEKDIETIDGFLEKQDKEISDAKKKYIRNQIIRGAIMGAGFATAGYAIRHFAGEFGLFGGGSVEKETIEEVGKIEEVKKVEKVSDIWGSKTAEKGDSSLLLAKKLYIEHAKELGYEESMGDKSKWAGKFSTRHIVGQYIGEHSEDYKELIDKIGTPPENPVELDKWISKVPGSTFNEVLNNKVPNLIHIGDTVSIDVNGNINAYDPEGKLRIGNLPIETQEIINTEGFEKIMAVEDFSKLSTEQIERIDKLFSKHLVASFEGFKSFDAAERAEKIAGLEKIINKLEKEPSSGFIKRQIQELNMVKEIWEKFGIEELSKKKISEIPQEPIIDETGTEIKGETPVGSEGNIKEINELFKKQGMEKIIEQVKAGKINREDFKEFLFDNARKDDGFVSAEEKEKINEIIKNLNK